MHMLLCTRKASFTLSEAPWRGECLGIQLISLLYLVSLLLAPYRFETSTRTVALPSSAMSLSRNSWVEERVSREWVGLGGSGEVSPTGAADDADEERRGSVSTQDSDLDPRYVVPAASTENVAVDIDIDVLSPSSPPAQSSAPGMTMLMVPSCPNRLAPDLRKASSFILEAFVPRSPPPVPHQRSRSLSDAIPSVQPLQ